MKNVLNNSARMGYAQTYEDLKDKLGSKLIAEAISNNMDQIKRDFPMAQVSWSCDRSSMETIKKTKLTLSAPSICFESAKAAVIGAINSAQGATSEGIPVDAEKAKQYFVDFDGEGKPNKACNARLNEVVRSAMQTKFLELKLEREEAGADAASASAPTRLLKITTFACVLPEVTKRVINALGLAPTPAAVADAVSPGGPGAVPATPGPGMPAMVNPGDVNISRRKAYLFSTKGTAPLLDTMRKDGCSLKEQYMMCVPQSAFPSTMSAPTLTHRPSSFSPLPPLVPSAAPWLTLSSETGGRAASFTAASCATTCTAATCTRTWTSTWPCRKVRASRSNGPTKGHLCVGDVLPAPGGLAGRRVSGGGG